MNTGQCPGAGTAEATGRQRRGLGVSLHAASVHLPVGLLVAGWVATVAWFVVPSPRWTDVITFCLAGGVIGAVVAGTTGFVELVRLGQGSPVDRSIDRLVTAHLSLVLTAAGIHGGALWAHLAGHHVWASALATVGCGALGVGAHLGGTLVYRHGIGTDLEPRSTGLRSTGPASTAEPG